MRGRFKKWAEPLINENPKLACFDYELNSNQKFLEFLNKAKDNLILEIGSGKGKFITSMASKFPSLYFLAIEKNVSIAGICLKEIIKSEMGNVFLISGDFEKIYPQIINTKFNTIFLNHPDPWPKKRHEKRRLTHPNFLLKYENLLNGNNLILKTDNLDMFNYSLENLKENNWNITYLNYDYKQDDNFDALTNYEEMFINKNIKINRLIANKKGNK